MSEATFSSGTVRWFCLNYKVQIIIFTALISLTHIRVGPLAWPNIKTQTQREAGVVDGHGRMDGWMRGCRENGGMACSWGVGGLCSTWSK